MGVGAGVSVVRACFGVGVTGPGIGSDVGTGVGVGVCVASAFVETGVDGPGVIADAGTGAGGYTIRPICQMV